MGVIARMPAKHALLLLLTLLCGKALAGCPPGTHTTLSNTCTDCDVGHYQPVSNQAACLQCPGGKYQPKKQGTSCLECPSGQSTLNPSTYEIIPGQTGCSYCVAGRTLGPDGCDVCPPNSFCNGRGGSSPCSAPVASVSYVLPSEGCTSTADAIVRACTSCASQGMYTFQPCSPTSDAVCRPCSVCQPMLEYEAAPCAAGLNTRCVPCSLEAGDVAPGGRCNPCPTGTVAAPGGCSQCQSQTYRGPNEAACLPCPSAAWASGAGAARCTAVCPAGSYAPDGTSCVPLTQAQSLVEAWDRAQIQAAAPTSTPGQFLVAQGQMLYVMGAGSSWLFAGGMRPPEDGVGLQAAFRNIRGLAWDPLSGGYLVLEEGGSLRWVTSQAQVSTLAPAPNSWVVIAFAGTHSSFLLSDGVGIFLLDVVSGSLQRQQMVLQQPLSLVVHQQRTYVLDQGLICQTSPFLIQFCGDGSGILEARVGASMRCSDISLGGSGALDLTSYRDKLYVLFFNEGWSGIAVVEQEVVTLHYVLPSAPEMVPLGLMAGMDGLFLATRNMPARILRVGLGGCLCNAGLFCSPEGHCVDAPPGAISPKPWSTVATPCPVGSIPAADARTCRVCPQNYTTAVQGGWICVRSCPPGSFLLPHQQGCAKACNSTEGLYHDVLLGQCLSCWLGSRSTGGRGMESCLPCPVGSYGRAPGLCDPCPAGTTTATTGTSRCMPSSYILCADGAPTCPMDPNTPKPMGLSAASLQVWANGSLRLEPHASSLLFAGDAFSAVYGGTTLFESSAPVQFSFPIFGLTLMEASGHFPVLYISSMLALEEGTPQCAEVYALSTFDKVLSHFMSQDLLKSPTIVLSQCILQPMVLAASGDGMLYAAVGRLVYAAKVLGTGSFPQSLFMQDPILQVDSGVVAFLLVRMSLEGNHLFMGTTAGQIHSVPPSAATLEGYQSIISTTSNGLRAMGAAGRRVFFLDNEGRVSEVLFSNVQGCVGGYSPTQLNVAWAGVCMQEGRGTGCPQGTYGPAPGVGSGGCLPCPPGSISPFAGSPVCTACVEQEVSSPDGVQCLAVCPSGSWKKGLGCAHCSAGYQLAGGVCVPCPAGAYSAESQPCTPCPQGYTSPPGAHSCIRICSEDSCAYDGKECVSLTRNYQVMSQIVMGGLVMALAVDDANGGVFFSDGDRIQYYIYDCTSYDTQCNKMGTSLLPASQYASRYKFSSLALCKQVKLSQRPQCAISRTLYVASLLLSNIYSLEVCQDSQGRITGTGPLTLVAGQSWAGFADGPFASARFNQPVDLELNAACNLLYVSDFANHRIRLLNFTSGLVSTFVGSGQPCWKAGYSQCAPGNAAARGCDPSFSDCASLQYPLGIGLSQDEQSLYIAANAVDSVFVATHGGQSLSNVCSFSYTNMAFGTVQVSLSVSVGGPADTQRRAGVQFGAC